MAVSHDQASAAGRPLTAAVVVSWEGAATTDRCVGSLLAQESAPDAVLVVDNASSEAERARLRAGFEAVGGFSAEIEVYYEDVDFCVGARACGFGAVVEPGAVVYHDGFRGFVAGLTPWAAFLKARNPWLLVRRRGGPGTWLTF